MSLQLSLPRPGPALLGLAEIDAAPTLTLRGRQRSEAQATLLAGEPAGAVRADGGAAQAAAAQFTLTLTF
jgi:hypothetical protein